MSIRPNTLLLFALLATSALAYERLQGPTELLFCDKTKTFGGYTLFGVGNKTFLLDLDGRVVHTWPVGTNPHLLDNGHILDASKDDPSGFPGFVEVDWDGKTVWEYSEKREGYTPHHDWVRIFNKALNAPTTLYIANKSISNAQALAAGADPKYAPYDEGQMDAIVEVDMQGRIVWEWCFFDHVVQDVDATKANYVGAGKTITDYWHSAAQVDNGFHGDEKGDGGCGHDGHKNRDGWGITLGEAQYRWFRQTLQQSKAKYKFVFAHHVLGTGRGGVDACDLYEWGGRNKRGEWEFDRMRPGWELPVHQLMAKYGVTIFFQGHDHLYCRQERDGVVYQEVPMPADQGYATYNEDRYASGVKRPNSGHLRVTVSPEQVTVDYVRCYLPKDETAQRTSGEVAYSYTVAPCGLMR